MESPFLKRLFFFINRYFMVPLHRLGLGGLMVNPFSGYIMVIKTVGRKTGKRRWAPVNYAIIKGSIYCLVGFGKKSHWYLNALAQPDLELLLPGRAISAHTEEVKDSDEHQAAVRKILTGAGFAGLFLGFNPRTATDEQVRAKTSDLPVLRFQPTGIGSGACDPGGGFWLTTSFITVLAILLVVWAC